MVAHRHDAPDYNRAFLAGCALNLLFVATEAVFGVRAGSLALLADAGHNLSDVLGLLLAWGASWLATHRPSVRRTYGLRRSTILAALLNAVLLLVAVGAIVWEAVRRFGAPAPLQPGTMMAVAAAGIAVNGLTALLFLRGRERDLNIRGAFLHMAADAAVSLGVVVSGLVILVTGQAWLDPVTSLVIAFVITIGTWGLLRESVDLTMDAVPAGIDVAEVRAYLLSLPGVTSIHDLHVWGMSTTEVALTAHLVCPQQTIDDRTLAGIAHDLHERFGIEHPTVQVERGAGEADCKLLPEDVV